MAEPKESRVKQKKGPLGREELSQIKDLFGGLHSISVHESEKKSSSL
jgi:hypothetical protein